MRFLVGINFKVSYGHHKLILDKVKGDVKKARLPSE